MGNIGFELGWRAAVCFFFLCVMLVFLHSV